MEIYGTEYDELAGCNNLRRLLSSDKPVIIAFSSPTCSACAMYRPEFETAKQMITNMNFVWFNIASCPDAAFELGIPGTPTTVVVAGGEIAGAWIGAVPAEYIVEAVKNIMKEIRDEKES